MKKDMHLRSLVGTLAGEGGKHSVAANPMGPDILMMTMMTMMTMIMMMMLLSVP